MMNVIKHLLPETERDRKLQAILLRVTCGIHHNETLDNLEYFLESGGENLTLDEYKEVRERFLGEDNLYYNLFIGEAISKGYDKDKAKRISMLFNDYLTDQHYRLSLTPESSRNDIDEHHRHTKFMGRLANGYPISEDLKNPESLENRAEKEESFYNFERAIFNPHDTRKMNERLEEAHYHLSKSETDYTRLSKYKIHTIEMAVHHLSKMKKGTNEKRQGVVSKAIGKVASYFAWKK